MKFILCFKEYPFKMSINAMKEFERETGKCMWSTIVEFVAQYMTNRDQSVAVLLAKLGQVMSFQDTAHFLHCLAKQENSKVSLSEIEDAMFHCGMSPNDAHGKQLQPWQLVATDVCFLSSVTPQRDR